MNTQAYAAMDASSPLIPWQFDRRQLRNDDVRVEIIYCGVCHSDLHQVRNEWGGSSYPMVPGHEIVGRVTETGSEVTRFRKGDMVGVGVIVDSCNHCKNCRADFEQYCEEGPTGTYNAMERDGSGMTQGGYSSQIVTKEKFVLKVSEKLDLKAVAPLLCAGITTWSPLRFAQVGPGMKVGIIGLGGLGHLGVKFAVSFGADVTVISTSPSKEKDARQLGATGFLVSSNREQMKAAAGSFDVLLDCVSAAHDYTPYLNLLALHGKLMVVGLPAEAPKVAPFALISNRRSITGSMIGSMKETQEMLDYCAEKNIVADIELIAIQEINDAYERMLKNDVKYRFVIDLKTLK